MPMTERGDGVLIVIPCLNEEAHLPGLLATLVGDSPDATIVVADGGSRDRSREIAARFAREGASLHLIDNPARIQSAGINRAVALHGNGHDWIVRIDAHCGYPPHYVAGLLAAAERTGADAVVVPMRTIGVGCFQRAAAAAQNSRLGTGGSAHRHVGEGRFVDHGHHALFRTDRFRSAGGYDETFACNEDAELDHRQALIGSRIWLEPALALGYFPRSTPAALFRQYHRYGIGRAMTVAKHRMRLKPRQAAPLAVAPALLLLLLSPLWWPLALPALAWATLCMVGGAVIGVRARDGCATMAGVAAMLMHAGWSLGFLRQWSLRGRGRHPIDGSDRAEG